MVLAQRDAPVPAPSAGQVAVRIRAASLNRGEFIAGHGLHTGAARPAGFEAAGEVTAVGQGVTAFHVGDRVMGRCDGAFSEHGVMNVGEAFAVPASLDWTQAAGAWLVYTTVHDMLIHQGRLRSGEWVLVAGVSSGVGVASLQVAQALGARVIGTSGSPEKLARLAGLGLDVPLCTRAPDFVPAVMAVTAGRGADLAVNAVGGSVFAACVEALGFEGRLATVGYVDGIVTAPMDILALHKKRLSLFGVSNKLRTPAQRVEANLGYARDILPMIADGRVVPRVDQVFALDDLPAARAAMDANTHLGKIVLRMD